MEPWITSIRSFGSSSVNAIAPARSASFEMVQLVGDRCRSPLVLHSDLGLYAVLCLLLFLWLFFLLLALTFYYYFSPLIIGFRVRVRVWLYVVWAGYDDNLRCKRWLTFLILGLKDQTQLRYYNMRLNPEGIQSLFIIHNVSHTPYEICCMLYRSFTSYIYSTVSTVQHSNY